MLCLQRLFRNITAVCKPVQVFEDQGECKCSHRCRNSLAPSVGHDRTKKITEFVRYGWEDAWGWWFAVCLVYFGFGGM